MLVVTLATAAGLVATTGTSAAAKNVKIKVLLLAETQGESVNAVPYYDNGAKLAAKELGASKVEYTRIPAPLTPAQAQTALLQAIDQKPDVIIGLPASSQVIPLSQTISQSNIPFFALSSAIQTIKGGPNGAANLFLIRPLSTDVAVAEANYVTKTLKAKKVGLVCVQNAFGTDSCNVARPVITKNGAQITAERTNSISRHRPDRRRDRDEGHGRRPRLQLPEPARRAGQPARAERSHRAARRRRERGHRGQRQGRPG